MKQSVSRSLPWLQRWAINTLAVLIASHLVAGIEYETVPSLLVASLLLGFLHVFVRPILLLLSLPLLVVTLWLFSLVINALLLYFVGALVGGFKVAGFGAAFWGGLVISVTSLVLNSITGTGDSQVTIRAGKQGATPGAGASPRKSDDDDDRPIIDV